MEEMVNWGHCDVLTQTDSQIIVNDGPGWPSLGRLQYMEGELNFTFKVWDLCQNANAVNGDDGTTVDEITATLNVWGAGFLRRSRWSR